MEKMTLPADTSSASVRSRQQWIAILLVLATMVPLVLWPGDVSWCIDEPRLIANAWHANHDGHLAVHGLYGNFGVCYGPVPTQVYQALLAITHDPYTLVILRALLCAAITAGSLLWLARSLDLPAWFAAAILIGPQITNHHRVLWDASFTIPFGTLALAAFASFLRTRGKWPLRITVFAALEVPLIHPQSLPLALPFLGYLLWRHRIDLWNDRRGLLWTVGLLLALNAKYIVIATFNVLYRITHATGTSYPGIGSRVVSMLAPLFGGNLLNGYDYVHTMARPAGPDWLVATASWAARLVYPFIWLGIGAACWQVPRVLRSWRDNGGSLSTRAVFSTVAIAGLLLQALIFGALRIPLGPQYYFGTFALHAFFAWLGIDLLRRVRLAAVLGGAFALGCAYVTLGVAYQLHHHGYEYAGWPTMRSAVELTRMLNAYEDSAAHTDIDFFKQYPQPLRTVRLLLPPETNQPKQKSGRLLITYAETNGVKNGRMIVTEWNNAPPPKATLMDITPLPRDWVPDPSTW